MTSTNLSEPGATESDRIEAWYRFVPREGWLPYDAEGLWATRLSEDTARVENVPFLQDGVAEGEVVRFVTDADGLRRAKERVEASGNRTVRVLPVPSGPPGRSARAAHERLSPFGLGGEVFGEGFPLVAVNVPAEADLGGIKELLVRGQEDGWGHFEVGCATDAWRSAWSGRRDRLR
ncbi:DUF4265 domain-containing protein [Streptomyces sp. V2I9]|uniref:DUF4265 domain-containing protein n=1 Tax=Streptomyces sp. V2I9 TaxID=3042304 RepID=UPI0027D77978|nr:DUF4265 domain-containing protein [Streptomyces sp. V2I9]